MPNAPGTLAHLNLNLTKPLQRPREFIPLDGKLNLSPKKVPSLPHTPGRDLILHPFPEVAVHESHRDA